MGPLSCNGKWTRLRCSSHFGGAHRSPRVFRGALSKHWRNIADIRKKIFLSLLTFIFTTRTHTSSHSVDMKLLVFCADRNFRLEWKQTRDVRYNMDVNKCCSANSGCRTSATTLHLKMYVHVRVSCPHHRHLGNYNTTPPSHHMGIWREGVGP